jgi:hypothetical protein
MFGALGSTAVSGAVLDECVKVLAVVSDPAAAKQSLDEIIAAVAELKSRQNAAAQVETQNTAALAALVDSQQKQNARAAQLDEREQAIANAQTAVDVAGAANAARSKSLDDREAALSARDNDVAAKEAALAAKVQQFRNALPA